MLKKLGQRLKDQKGLTLIELLAVIVILGIIAAIAIPSIGGIIQKSKEDAIRADAIQILNSAKTYVAANGIPENSSLSPTDLDPYVDSTKITKNYTVSVKEDADNKITYELSTSADVDAGKTTVKFVDADISEINAKDTSAVVVTKK